MLRLLLMDWHRVKRTKYFIGSFLVMMLSPVLSLIIMSLNETGFKLGDFNRINILIISLVLSRTLFPMLSMSLIKTGNGLDGIKSAFLSPVMRRRVIYSKVFFSLIWMVGLIIFSTTLVTITEFVMFRDINVIGIVLESVKLYILSILYSLPFLVFGMLLVLLLKNILLPTIILTGTMVIGYFIQIVNPNNYLPTAIPRYIATGNVNFEIILMNYLVLLIISGICLFVLNYFLVHKDYK